jgi:hypothetical protein
MSLFIRLALVTLTMLFALPREGQAQRVNTVSDVAGLIDSAQREVIVVAPVLRVKVIANALRKAVVERGLSLKILTGSSSVRDGASYWWGLQQAGADLRTVSSVTGYEVIVDRQVRVSGDLIGRILSPTELANTVLERGAGVQVSAARVLRVWEMASVFKAF